VRVLLTGATGFLGRRLLAHLITNGHEITILVRPNCPNLTSPLFESPNVQIFQADLKSNFTLDTLGDFDAVFTLAQERDFRSFPDHATNTFNVNVSANVRIWEWAAQHGVPRVIHASSGGIYGSRGDAAFREDCLPPVHNLNSFYLGTKLCSEINFRSFVPFFETAVIIRPFFIYGPGQESDKFVQRMITYVRDGTPVQLAIPDGIRVNPIFIEDAARIFAQSLALDGSHTLNCAGSEVVTVRDLVEMIASILNRQPHFVSLSDHPGDCVGDTRLQYELFGAPLMGLREGLELAVRATPGCG
jgi:UDP-glucose 4-epimerase